ncbi:MAG TPA: hybrid sensor histidine kinase/response regulator, partial [Cytophagaceae bacterium]
LTGYADIEAVIDAINKGKVYRYIKKPWDRHEIQLAVENGYEIYKTREELRIKTEQLEKVNSELSRFVYSTSHDLKAPIMTMLGVMKLRRWKEELLKMTPFYRSYTKALRN